MTGDVANDAPAQLDPSRPQRLHSYEARSSTAPVGTISSLAFLDVNIDPARWPPLVAAASFANMKRRADEVAPGAHLDEWTSNADFFRKARLGEWREVLSPKNQDLYERLTRERLEPPLKAWLEIGRAAGDPNACECARFLVTIGVEWVCGLPHLLATWAGTVCAAEGQISLGCALRCQSSWHIVFAVLIHSSAGIPRARVRNTLTALPPSLHRLWLGQEPCAAR